MTGGSRPHDQTPLSSLPSDRSHHRSEVRIDFLYHLSIHVFRLVFLLEFSLCVWRPRKRRKSKLRMHFFLFCHFWISEMWLVGAWDFDTNCSDLSLDSWELWSGIEMSSLGSPGTCCSAFRNSFAFTEKENPMSLIIYSMNCGSVNYWRLHWCCSFWVRRSNISRWFWSGFRFGHFHLG